MLFCPVCVCVMEGCRKRRDKLNARAELVLLCAMRATGTIQRASMLVCPVRVAPVIRG